MWDCTGLMPSSDRPSNTVCSYSSVHDLLSAKSKSYATKFKQFVLDYAIEWEQVVTTRVNAGLKKSALLRRDLDHYQKKVEALRLTANQNMAKGKSVPPTTAEKLSRNEEKLIQAKQGYNKLASDLCILMEEVTERSWRDLHPLLIKCAQFDMTMSGDEAKILSSLNQVVSELKQVAGNNGLSPQARLKDIASLNPELLSTRPGGVSGLRITSGDELMGAATLSSGLDMAQPPGSVGPQGLGGFPVQLAASPTSPAYNLSRDSSFNSFASAPAPSSMDPLSTMNMLTISQASAPAPTMEDVYSANRGSAMTIHSAPNSGNLPPLSPAYNRSSSFDNRSAMSDYSGYSGAPVAAAPAAPPPPPPGADYGAPPSSYGAPPPSYGAPSPYGAPPPMAPAMAMGPAPGQYGAPSPPSYAQAPWGAPGGPPPVMHDPYATPHPGGSPSTNPFGM